MDVLIHFSSIWGMISNQIQPFGLWLCVRIRMSCERFGGYLACLSGKCMGMFTPTTIYGLTLSVFVQFASIGVLYSILLYCISST